jgi:hypothetical protein
MSRFTVSMKSKERAYRKRLGNLSLTDAERKENRRRMNESLESYLSRLEAQAREQQRHPKHEWHYLARVLQVVPSPLNHDERRLVRYHCKRGNTVARAEKAIARYRRLTGTF